MTDDERLEQLEYERDRILEEISCLEEQIFGLGLELEDIEAEIFELTKND